jgi:hypothetical protein
MLNYLLVYRMRKCLSVRGVVWALLAGNILPPFPVVLKKPIIPAAGHLEGSLLTQPVSKDTGLVYLVYFAGRASYKTVLKLQQIGALPRQNAEN